MWFRNLMIYRLAGDHALTAEKIAEALASKIFVPAGSHDLASFGWVAPVKHRPDDLAIAQHDAVLIAVQTESKILPPAVVNQEADRRIAKIEAKENRRVGRREQREIRERVAEEFLPRAFSKLSAQRAIIDLKNNLVIVDSGSASKAENLLSHLRSALGELPTRLIQTACGPRSVITSWLRDGAPENFTLDDAVELESVAEGGAKAKFQNAPLDAEAIKTHLGDMEVTRLAVSWNDRISFTISDALEFKRLAMLDQLAEDQQSELESCEDMAAEFDARFFMHVGTLRQFIPAVFEAMGGEINDLFDAPPASAEQSASPLPWAGPADQDPLYEKAEKLVMLNGRVSISFVQRELRIGYNYAARLIEKMEENGIVSPMNESGAREVLAA